MILYGVGSAFHVLVGGWAVLASLVVWALDSLCKRRNDENVSRFKSFWRNIYKGLPGLFAGGAISLLGLVPALRLDMGATPAEIARAHQIYVFERLSHHLVASSLPWTFLTRFAGLVLAFVATWLVVDTLVRKNRKANVVSDTVDAARFSRLKAFVVVSLLIACVGFVADWGSIWLEKIGKLANRQIVAAGILRYYWYRLSDWVVPFGLVFLLGRCVSELAASLKSGWNAQRDSTRKSASAIAGSAFFWLAIGLTLYWGLRTYYCGVARSVAASSAVDGLVPLPKPTEAVSFMTTLVVLGFALVATTFIAGFKKSRVPFWLATGLAVWLSVLAVFAPTWRLATFVDLRGTKVIPRSAPPKESIADGWIDACRWCRDNTPEKAIFLVPRGCDSFKWEAQRAEAGSWKEIPQDAKSITLWYKKMERFYANPGTEPGSPTRWNQPLVGVFINKGRDKVLEEAKMYGYQYAIVETPPYVIATIPEALKRWKEYEENDLVYQNDQFIVLKFD